MIGQVYLNGEWYAPQEAKISAFDRGFFFADGVYEVIPITAGTPFGLEPHLDRLFNSLQAIRLTIDDSRAQLRALITELCETLLGHGHHEGAVYLQITRGAALRRDHAFPTPSVTPTMMAYVFPLTPAQPGEARVARAITVADQRWARCDIKSISLLPNVLARQQAVEQGCDEAIFIKEGQALEGAAMNLFAVVDGQLRTAPADGQILGGITRMLLLEMLENAPSIPVCIKALTTAELARADEVFLTSSTKDLLAVSEIDGQPVGLQEAYPGPVTTKLQQRFSEYKTLKSGAETL